MFFLWASCHVLRSLFLPSSFSSDVSHSYPTLRCGEETSKSTEGSEGGGIAKRWIEVGRIQSSRVWSPSICTTSRPSKLLLPHFLSFRTRPIHEHHAVSISHFIVVTSPLLLLSWGLRRIDPEKGYYQKTTPPYGPPERLAICIDHTIPQQTPPVPISLSYVRFSRSCLLIVLSSSLSFLLCSARQEKERCFILGYY